MRKSSGRGGFGVADPIGAHPLADGREAWVTWLHDSGTHCHVVVWIPGDEPPRVVEHVACVNAAVESEKILRELESWPRRTRHSTFAAGDARIERGAPSAIASTRAPAPRRSFARYSVTVTPGAGAE